MYGYDGFMLHENKRAVYHMQLVWSRPSYPCIVEHETFSVCICMYVCSLQCACILVLCLCPCSMKRVQSCVRVFENCLNISANTS